MDTIKLKLMVPDQLIKIPEEKTAALRFSEQPEEQDSTYKKEQAEDEDNADALYDLEIAGEDGDEFLTDNDLQSDDGDEFLTDDDLQSDDQGIDEESIEGNCNAEDKNG
jgi:hypothetical protein